MKKVESGIEHFLFASRWLMTPVYVGLVLAMLAMLIKFGKQLWLLLMSSFEINGLSMDSAEIIVAILTLIDITLVMNLMLIIIFSGYETFVSKMDELHSHEDRPDWMGHIGFNDLKIKLIGSIVAISGIELLKAFMSVDDVSDRHLGWMIGVHLTFVISGVMYALMNRLSEKH
ncbi:MAG: hypothetical protein BWK73_41825 [Thiothrix lacustris]|uniref:UPF0114 protein BWK73_41825 n=1 Tax=Thiothrix lacustris TaxID=525917 RepID=A0A1Y1QD49_9GAMM|nr:MAG: hypothetical protein BWK73_41825 [Thiothrix lacustris]